MMQCQVPGDGLKRVFEAGIQAGVGGGGRARVYL